MESVVAVAAEVVVEEVAAAADAAVAESNRLVWMHSPRPTDNFPKWEAPPELGDAIRNNSWVAVPWRCL